MPTVHHVHRRSDRMPAFSIHYDGTATQFLTEQEYSVFDGHNSMPSWQVRDGMRVRVGAVCRDKTRRVRVYRTGRLVKWFLSDCGCCDGWRVVFPAKRI